MTEHLDFDALNDLVDGQLSPEKIVAAHAHLATCVRCQAAHDALTRTISAAAALPRDVVPPAASWDGVLARLAPRRRRVFNMSFAGLAAAALLIAALSAGVTALVMRNDTHDARVSSAPTQHSVQPRHIVFAAEEKSYAESAAQLEAMLAGRRDSLAPSTVATVERSLRVADSAIAEARAALERDPANRAIEAILVSNYDRKIDLLRRATELSPRT